MPAKRPFGPFAVTALNASTALACCPVCQAEVSDLEEGLLLLAEGVSESPPAHLKSRIMGAIENERGAEAVDLAPLRSMRFRWDFAFAAAAALVVFCAGLLVVLNNQLDHAETIAAVFEAEDATTVDFESDVGNARFVYSTQLGRGVFWDRSLEEPAGDRVYELWLIGAEGPVPAGIFRPDSEDTVLVEDLRPGLILALTEEPAGGVDQPTGDVLLSAEL